MNSRRLKVLAPLLLGMAFAASGCGSSEESLAATNSNPSVVSAPVARDDVYTVARDMPLVVPVTTTVLANDDVNPVSGLPVSVTFQSASVAGGTITATSNDGTFTYTPAAGFLGTDTFSYELSNGRYSSRAIVSNQVAQQGSGIFVDSLTGNDTTGSSTDGSPYATVQAAVAAAGPGADIVVLPGRGTYTGTVQLLDGQRLLGTQSTLVRAQGLVRPTLSGPIILADGNTVDALRVARTEGIAIDGDAQTSGTITNCEVANTRSGTGIQLRGVTGNWLVEGNTISEVDGIGLDMDTQSNGSAVIRANGNSISGCRLFGLGAAAFGQSRLTLQVEGNQLEDNGRGLGPDSVALGAFFPVHDGGTLNLRILDNQNSGVYGFVQAGDTSAINVEQFGQVSELNKGGTFIVLQGAVTPVPEGFCGF